MAFLYIQGFCRHGNYTSQNVVIPGQKDVFSGKYKSTAFSPSLGIAYRF